MRKLLNTLYVTTPLAYLSKDGDNLVVKAEGVELFRIPIRNIEEVVMFSQLGASPGCMRLCIEHNVGMTFLSPSGSYIASLDSGARGNVLLRRAQYRMADSPDEAGALAQRFVAGKVVNQQKVLSRFVRDYRPERALEEKFEAGKSFTKQALKELEHLTDVVSIMGIEGSVAQRYFELFPHLVRNQDFSFPGRNRRPPTDPINAMLSFFYTLLSGSCRAALQTVGLDPYVGFLHADRPGRSSLALDLMEELRAYLVDRFVLSVVNNRQVSPKDFIQQGERGVVMTDDCRKKLLVAWQRRKSDEIKHPYLLESVPLGLLPYIQALLLAKYIRETIDDYPVFVAP